MESLLGLLVNRLKVCFSSAAARILRCNLWTESLVKLSAGIIGPQALMFVSHGYDWTVPEVGFVRQLNIPKT